MEFKLYYNQNISCGDGSGEVKAALCQRVDFLPVASHQFPSNMCCSCCFKTLNEPWTTSKWTCNIYLTANCGHKRVTGSWWMLKHGVTAAQTEKSHKVRAQIKSFPLCSSINNNNNNISLLTLAHKLMVIPDQVRVWQQNLWVSQTEKGCILLILNLIYNL